MTVDSTPAQLLEEVDDWRSYIAALEQCDRWWSARKCSTWSVLGERCSWSETIQVLHDVVKRETWSTLADSDQKRLLGRTREGGWALLGNMQGRGDAQKNVFGCNSKKFQDTVRRVVHAKDSEFPGVAIKAYEELQGLKGIGPGIATRLLALARPDRFVSLNKASVGGLAQYLRLKSTNLQTLEKPKYYGQILEAIYDKTWFREPAPKDTREKTICWMRVALLDCFVYDPDRSSGPT